MQVCIQMNVSPFAWLAVCASALGAYASCNAIYKMTNESNENLHAPSTVFNISFECGMATEFCCICTKSIHHIIINTLYRTFYRTCSSGLRKLLRSNSKTPRVHFILPPLLLQLVTTMMATASGLNPTTVLHQSCIIYTRSWTHTHTSECAEPNESCT